MQYLIDPTQTEFTTVITKVAGDRVQFADSIIYPGGGGQPLDVATVTQNSHSMAVLAATADGWYQLAGMPVRGAATQHVDWPSRHRNMRYHTFLHLIASIAARSGAHVGSNQILPDHARIELQWPDADAASAFSEEALNAALHAAIAAQAAVTARVVARAAIADESQAVRTLVSLIPASVSTVRLVRIAGFDEEACAGTHVANTADLPAFSLKMRKKGACKRRLKITLAEPQAGA